MAAHYAITDTTERDAALHDARTLLYRAANADRWGCVAQDLVWQAAQALRNAGYPDLADACEEIEMGCGLDEIAAVVWGMR